MLYCRISWVVIANEISLTARVGRIIFFLFRLRTKKKKILFLVGCGNDCIGSRWLLACYLCADLHFLWYNSTHGVEVPWHCIFMFYVWNWVFSESFREGSIRGYGIRTSQSVKGSDSWVDDPITRHIISLNIVKEEEGENHLLWPLVLHIKGPFYFLVMPLVEPHHLKTYARLCNRSDCGNGVGADESLSSLLLDLPSITGYGKLGMMLLGKNKAIIYLTLFLIIQNLIQWLIFLFVQLLKLIFLLLLPPFEDQTNFLSSELF